MKKLVILLALLLPVISFAQIDVEQIEDINGYPAFIITHDDHITDLNKTRSLVDSEPLVETPSMMLKSKKRAIWAAKNIKSWWSTKDNPMGGHRGYDRSGSENTATNSGVYIKLQELFEQKDMASFIKEYSTDQFGGFLDYILRKGEGYNNSNGHYVNRIDKKWTECGNAYILFYKPNREIEDSAGNKRNVNGYVIWHYELFQ